MGDPAGEIRHLLARYQEAQCAKDLSTLAAIHWQDTRLTHVWSPGHSDLGWAAYEETLRREFSEMTQVDFHLDDLRPEIFGGRFAVVNARWRCEFRTAAGRDGTSSGPVTFVLSMMGGSWKIVADHFSVS